eukprot:364808-Chlamydomonas_euryale.AAC.16
MIAARSVSTSRPSLARPSRAGALRTPLVVRASAEQPQNTIFSKAGSATLAGLVAVSMLGSAMVPDEALAARSSGRAGGSSSGFASRRAAPSRPAAPG